MSNEQIHISTTPTSTNNLSLNNNEINKLSTGSTFDDGSQLNNNHQNIDYHQVDLHQTYLPEKYSNDEQNTLRLIYLTAIVLWIVVAFFLFKLLHVGTLLLMCIPILLFGLTIKNLDQLDEDCQGYLGHTDHMNFWLFAAFPILSWVNDRYNGDSGKFYTIITTGIVISIISLFDFWIPKKYEKYMKHIRSILNTCSLTLLLVSICMMFLEHHNTKNHQNTSEEYIQQPFENQSELGVPVIIVQ
jgi:hypothetical protein